MIKEFLPRYSKNEFLLILMDKPYIPKEPSTTKEICNGMSLRHIDGWYRELGIFQFKTLNVINILKNSNPDILSHFTWSLYFLSISPNHINNPLTKAFI